MFTCWVTLLLQETPYMLHVRFQCVTTAKSVTQVPWKVEPSLHILFMLKFGLNTSDDWDLVCRHTGPGHRTAIWYDQNVFSHIRPVLFMLNKKTIYLRVNSLRGLRYHLGQLSVMSPILHQKNVISPLLAFQSLNCFSLSMATHA